MKLAEISLVVMALSFCFWPSTAAPSAADGPNGMIRNYPGDPNIIYVPHFLSESAINLLDSKGFRQWAQVLREQDASYKGGEDRLWRRDCYLAVWRAIEGVPEFAK